MTKEIQMQVTEEISVSVLPDVQHEYLMTTKEVSVGYGTSKYVILKAFQRNGGEFTRGKHYLLGEDILSTHKMGGLLQANSILYTKRGIVRLGFFIKSERAKLFRDWAEELIINVMESESFLQPVPVLAAPKKRNHNRLTQERMIAILADVAKVENHELRLSLISKLGV